MKLLAALLFTLPLLAAEKPQGTFGLGYTLHHAEEGEFRQWLFVRGVMPGGAAEKAGVRAQDLIVAVNGKPLNFADDVALLDFFATIREGDRVKLKLLRGDERRDVTVTAAAMTPEQRRLWQQNYEVAKREQQKRRGRE
ncbi:MAG TPA: PDZ domain-containing protein [Thermoanaerobaculia bacterium]